jgi:hypothetical protein
MRSLLSNKLKAASLFAAFLFLAPPAPTAAAAATAPGGDMTSFPVIREKAVDLLLQKKKSQSLQLLMNYIKTDLSRGHRNEARELLLTLAQKFMAKETQEAYESSVNLTLDSPKESMKNIEQCLTADAQQLNCLIQKARLQAMSKNKKALVETINEIKDLSAGTHTELWLSLEALKGEPDFKNKQIIKNLPEQASEENFALLVLELDRCFKAKNYSRAKDIIGWLNKNYPDWPDLMFYQYRIDFESAEEKQKASAEELQLYTNKCKSLSKSVARKFRYDFELCSRSME